jgi:hypothetical protein
MKRVLCLNILLGNPSNTLPGVWGFKVISMNCYKTPELKPFKTLVVHELQSHDFTNRVNICRLSLQSVHDGEIDPCPIFFSREPWFHFHGETDFAAEC